MNQRTKHTISLIVFIGVAWVVFTLFKTTPTPTVQAANPPPIPTFSPQQASSGNTFLDGPEFDPASVQSQPPAQVQAPVQGQKFPYSYTPLLPLDQLLAALDNYGFKQSVLSAVSARYAFIVDQSRLNGYDESLGMAIWIEETAAGTASKRDFGCSTSAGTGFDNQWRCWIGLWDKYAYGNQFAECRGIDQNPELSLREFMLIYEGGYKSCRNNEFLAERGFDSAIHKFYNLVTGGYNLPDF